MTPKLKPLSQQIVVVTGASSGIGLATAEMAAEAGAGVVLAARTAAALDKAVQGITAKGGRAVAVVADVGVRAEVERVAAQAIERFGRIDTWVNNAGVGIWGRAEEVEEADMRRLFDTNFWGQVHGALAALPHLKREGGALVNVGSLASDRAVPLQGIYSASKHALKGFTEALRDELEGEGAPVSVTLIKPGSIGTPLPQHVKNYTDHEAKLPPPVYAPEDVARAILRAATHPVRDVTVGSAARVISTASRLVPGVVDRLSAIVAPVQLGPKAPTPTDNLWEGRAEAKVRGDTQGSMIRPSLYMRAAAHPVLAAAVAGAAAGGAYLLRRRMDGAGPARQAPTGPEPEPPALQTHMFEAAVLPDDGTGDGATTGGAPGPGTMDAPVGAMGEGPGHLSGDPLASGGAMDGTGDEVDGMAGPEDAPAPDVAAVAPAVEDRAGDPAGDGADAPLGDAFGSEELSEYLMGDGGTAAAGDGVDDGGTGDGAADDGNPASERGVSNGPNARPLNDTISQSGPGLPDDSGEPIEITPEEEARIAERIQAL